MSRPLLIALVVAALMLTVGGWRFSESVAYCRLTTADIRQ